jgi:hypothetical protein
VARWEAVVLQARTGLNAELQRWLGTSNTAANYRDEHVSWVRGELALAEGRPAEAATLLAQSVDRSRGRLDWTPVLVALQSLSSAVEASRGPQAALDVIVNNIYPADRLVYYWLGQSAWLDLQARRARLLRKLGRPTEAEVIETQLRKFLAYADPDMLIVKQLATTARRWAPPDPGDNLVGERLGA